MAAFDRFRLLPLLVLLALARKVHLHNPKEVSDRHRLGDTNKPRLASPTSRPVSDSAKPHASLSRGRRDDLNSAASSNSPVQFLSAQPPAFPPK